jgi:hypothetical protein
VTTEALQNDLAAYDAAIEDIRPALAASRNRHVRMLIDDLLPGLVETARIAVDRAGNAPAVCDLFSPADSAMQTIHRLAAGWEMESHNQRGRTLRQILAVIGRLRSNPLPCAAGTMIE